MSKQKNPFSRPTEAERLKGVAVPSKRAALRVWLPSRRCRPSCPRKPLSASHALGLRSSEPYSGRVAQPRFPATDPLLRFPAKRSGLAFTLQRLALTRPAAHPAPGYPLGPGWSRCSPELWRLSGLPPPELGRITFLLPAPLALPLSASEEAENRSPRGSVPPARHLPPFEGRRPV